MPDERERQDECPECGEIAVPGWVLGHHYCRNCDHTFRGDGEIIQEDGVYPF